MQTDIENVLLDRKAIKSNETYPADNSSSNITVSTSSALIALLISATFPEPIYVLGLGLASLKKNNQHTQLKSKLSSNYSKKLLKFWLSHTTYPKSRNHEKTGYQESTHHISAISEEWKIEYFVEDRKGHKRNSSIKIPTEKEIHLVYPLNHVLWGKKGTNFW